MSSGRARPADPEAGLAARVRTGLGYDSHRFGPGTALRLGGVSIPADRSLIGHSDGDAVAHAITDAILGASGAGDIGALFRDDDEVNRGRDSLEMLKDLEKEREITEDDRRHAAEKIEGLTKEHIERVEKALKAKEDEIMAV